MEDKQVIMIAIAAFALGWWLKSQQKKEGFVGNRLGMGDIGVTRAVSTTQSQSGQYLPGQGLAAGQAMAKTGPLSGFST